MPPDEAANDDPGGGCPVFPPPLEEDLLVPLW